MRAHSSLALFTLALLAGSAAHATEVKTYKGVLGKSPIILEMSEPLEDGDREARYSYLHSGLDIPLHVAAPGKGGVLVVSEEEPCSQKHCKAIEDQEQSDFEDVIPNPPIGAEWTMTLSDDEKKFTGVWKDKAGKKSFPISLSLVASREIQTDFVGANSLLYDLVDLGTTADDYPYDKLRFSVPMKKGSVSELNGATYRIDTDERIGADYPVIEALPAKEDTPITNQWLLERRMNLYMQDFNCASRQYQGFRWSNMLEGENTPYKTQSSARLDFLNDRLIGVSESGSFFCGGAHPDNFVRYQLGDVISGESIAPESLVAGFEYKNFNNEVIDPATPPSQDPGSWVASEKLAAYVTKNRVHDENEAETGCEYDTLIPQNLTVALRGDNLVFTLKDLPNYAAACYEDLLSVPLDKAGKLLTDKGKDYLASYLQ